MSRLHLIQLHQSPPPANGSDRHVRQVRHVIESSLHLLMQTELLRSGNVLVLRLELAWFHATFYERSSSLNTTLYPNMRSAFSIPPCRSPTVSILPKSTPITTRVWAISGERPVTIRVAPMSRAASTVC